MKRFRIMRTESVDFDEDCSISEGVDRDALFGCLL